MTALDRDQMLDLYKLHAEFADRLGQRREGANRLFLSLLSGVLVFLAACLRFGIEGVSANLLMWFFGAAGISLCVGWYIVLHSYRQLAKGKFKALYELEKKLPFRFYRREWKLLTKIGYRRLTVVESFLPTTFALLFVSVIVFAVLV